MTNGRAFSYECDRGIGVEINHTLAAKKVVSYELHNYTIAIAWDCGTVFFCCDHKKASTEFLWSTLPAESACALRIRAIASFLATYLWYFPHSGQNLYLNDITNFPSFVQLARDGTKCPLSPEDTLRERNGQSPAFPAERTRVR
ncbi:hypothetical protein [Scytonema sp. PCC 10023]|uniref:hypothetical protein n=1 Tax=Scytonema sp. PCC 10023 TaxID=1680591 RepID=UPI0039C68AE9